MSVNGPITSTRPSEFEAARSPRVGVLLRRAREERHLGLDEVAATLCIRAFYLEALESGAYERLPGRTYAVGFVRGYAEYLGLDSEEAVRLFKREEQPFEAERNLSMPTPIESRSIPGRRVLVTGVVLAICGYGLWSYLGDRNYPDAVAPVPASLAGDTAAPSEAKAAVTEPSAVPPSAAPSAASAAAVPTQQVAAASAPSATAPGQPPASGTTAPAAAAPQRIALAASTLPSSPAAVAMAAAPQPSASEPAQPGHVFGVTDGPARIVLRFTANCWMQVRGTDSEMSSGRLMRAGDVYRVPDHAGLSLRVGNSDALGITVDGKPVTLPRAASRVQTIALDPVRLADGTAEIAGHRSASETARSARANRAAAAAATAAAAQAAPAATLSDDLPPPRPMPVRLPAAGPPPGALNTPPPPPDQPPPPDEND